MPSPAGSDLEVVWPSRFAIFKENADCDPGLLSGRIQDAASFVTGQSRRRPVALARDVAIRYRPSFSS
jgi:hypothetical protein